MIPALLLLAIYTTSAYLNLGHEYVKILLIPNTTKGTSEHMALPMKFNFKSLLANAPEDEYEDIESSSVMPEPVPTEDLMQVLSPVQKSDDGVKTRVKVLTAATPQQLEDKVNAYVSDIETNPKLSTLTLDCIQYSSNDQGYSAMLVCKKIR